MVAQAVLLAHSPRLYKRKAARNSLTFNTRVQLITPKEVGHVVRIKRVIRSIILRLLNVVIGPNSYTLSANVKNYSAAVRMLQDNHMPPSLTDQEKFIVIVVPEHNEMSGGIYSFFSIATTLEKTIQHHEHQVIIMTRPNEVGVTYFKQTNFRNHHIVRRFEQIETLKKARSIHILLPEYAVYAFPGLLPISVREYLATVPNLSITILNQNVRLAPSRKEIRALRAITANIGESVAHYSYYGSDFVARNGVPQLYLPAYTDLSPYNALPSENKQKLIIYSPDRHSQKKQILEHMRDVLHDYTFIEIKNMSFDRYMHLACNCRYSVTFGEGFDGYLAQPTIMGGVGFAVYDEDFFHDPELKTFDNIFESFDELAVNICALIQAWDEDHEQYVSVGDRLRRVYDEMYSAEDYTERVIRLAQRDYDIYPVGMGETPTLKPSDFAQ